MTLIVNVSSMEMDYKIRLNSMEIEFKNEIFAFVYAKLKPEMVFGLKSVFPYALKESLVWQ